MCQLPYPANRFQRPCAKISNLRRFTMYLIELIVSKNFIPLLKHPIVTCFVVLFAAVIFFELIIYWFLFPFYSIYTHKEKYWTGRLFTAVRGVLFQRLLCYIKVLPRTYPLLSRACKWGTLWSLSQGASELLEVKVKSFEKGPILLTKWEIQKFDPWYFWCPSRQNFN